MVDRSKAFRLVGETAREVGMLLVVFAPLDAAFQQGQVNAALIVLLAASGLLLIAAGIIVESRKEQEP